MNMNIDESNGNLAYNILQVGIDGQLFAHSCTTFEEANECYKRLKDMKGFNIHFGVWIQNPENILQEVDACSKGGTHDYCADTIHVCSSMCGDEHYYRLEIKETCKKCGHARIRQTPTLAKKKMDDPEPIRIDNSMIGANTVIEVVHDRLS